MHFLKDHPDVPFGVHLTAICDSDDYSWGPLTSKDKVPNLVDQAGHFYSFEGFHNLHHHSNMDQLELEFRAQIETVLASGLKPAYLDWHVIHLDNREEIFELMFRLAREYGMAFRVTGRDNIQKVQHQGLSCSDYDLMDIYTLDPVNKPERYARMLHELPAGLSEWAVHTGRDNSELLAMEPDGNHFRQTGFDFWTSQEANDIVTEEGIVFIDYRAIQKVWRGM